MERIMLSMSILDKSLMGLIVALDQMKLSVGVKSERVPNRLK